MGATTLRVTPRRVVLEERQWSSRSSVPSFQVVSTEAVASVPSMWPWRAGWRQECLSRQRQGSRPSKPLYSRSEAGNRLRNWKACPVADDDEGDQEENMKRCREEWAWRVDELHVTPQVTDKPAQGDGHEGAVEVHELVVAERSRVPPDGQDMKNQILREPFTAGVEELDGTAATGRTSRRTSWVWPGTLSMLTYSDGAANFIEECSSAGDDSASGFR